MLKFSLVDHFENVQQNITQNFNEYTLNYPCQDSSSCTYYQSTFHLGIYKLELYGASSGIRNENYISLPHNPKDRTKCISQEYTKMYGGNIKECKNIGSIAGAGGYTSGILKINKKAELFFAIGGQGQLSFNDKTANNYEDENRPKGGFNGGGKGLNYYLPSNPSECGSSGGGGATDMRIEVNDLFHRVIVAGGGGGSDNQDDNSQVEDDGSGGSGGGLSAQGYWDAGIYIDQYVADQSHGFSFGNGEAAQQYHSLSSEGNTQTDNDHPTWSDRAGAGGGWYGGFASHRGTAGAGGGSSFALTKNSEIPSHEIQVYDEYYEKLEKDYYAFDINSEYLIESAVFVQGIWYGNGKIKITILRSYSCLNKTRLINYLFTFILTIII